VGRVRRRAARRPVLGRGRPAVGRADPAPSTPSSRRSCSPSCAGGSGCCARGPRRLAVLLRQGPMSPHPGRLHTGGRRALAAHPGGRVGARPPSGRAASPRGVGGAAGQP
jgi:hypothetical protein